MKEDGRLCNFGLLELLVSAGEHHIRDFETEYLVSLVKEFLGQCVVIVEVFTHAYEL